MTDPVLIIDCAYPPSVYPTSWNGIPIKGCCVYVGGDTPHDWTDAEIARMMAVPEYEYIVPIFTRDNPTGADEGIADALKGVAWSVAHKQPRGTYFLVDFETAVNSPYVQAFDSTIQSRAGLLEMLYGSKATVVKNVRPSGGYDEAQWDFKNDVPADSAEQFAAYPLYDVNSFKDPSKLWNFRATTAAPTPTTQTAEDEDMGEIEKSATNGRAGFSFPAGSKHVVQVSCDPDELPTPAQGQPKQLVLRGALLLKKTASTPGPWVFSLTVDDGGTGTYEIPVNLIASCRGVVLKAPTTTQVYDACVL